MRRLDPDKRRTQTFDNGREFARHESIANRLGLEVYFAHAYSSWERGANENTNGLLIEVFDRWARILPMKMTETGELPRETMRTRPMTYTLMALNHTMETAAIARRFGVELFDLTVNGRTIHKAVDYATHYLLHMGTNGLSSRLPRWTRRHCSTSACLRSLTANGAMGVTSTYWTHGAAGRPVVDRRATLLYAEPSDGHGPA